MTALLAIKSIIASLRLEISSDLSLVHHFDEREKENK